MTEHIPAPPDPHEETVLPEWIDYNGHMNVAYYVLVFDHATEVLLDYAGLDKGYRARTGHSVFVIEAHVTHEGEVMAGDRVSVATRVLDHDAKRLHVFHHMYRRENGGGTDVNVLAATNELMILHVDLSTRRSVPMPESVRRRIRALAEAQSALPRPSQAGRAVGLKSKRSTAG